MRKFRTNLLFFIFILNFFCINPLMADEISLKNGDRITGEFLNMKDGKLTIKTSYAGEIGIKWTEVANIKTDNAVSVMLSDDSLIKGSPRGIEEGKMMLSSDKVAETVSFSVEDVKSINPPKEPAVKIKARANVAITSTDGNTVKDTSHFDGEFSARTAKNRYTAGIELNSTKDSGIKTESNTLGYIKYDHFLSEKWFAYSNALFEKDKFKDLNLRSLIGVGSGYQFFETPITNLSLEAGINYVDADYISADDESYSSGRWAVNYDRYFYNKAFQFFHFHEGFISLEDSNNMFFRSRTGIRVPLFVHFNATLQYNLDWEKTPSPGREKTDKTLMFTLGYQLEN